MALTSPALTLANEVLFGNIRPVLDSFRRLGATDFSADNPTIAAKPGTTVKVPWSAIDTAVEFNADSNNYLTGGDTDWISCTATHFLKGYDISGVNVDQGVDAAKMKNLFSYRASKAIASAMQGTLKTALEGVTVSTAVTLPASPTLAQYMGLAADLTWLDRANCMLAVKGSELALIKGVFAAAKIVGTNDELAGYLGFKGMVLVPGLDDRIEIIPDGTLGFIGRVPAILAEYPEYGTEVDPDTGLAVGIVRANDQKLNRQVVNADMWFGVVAASASANASTTKGIISVGTSV